MVITDVNQVIYNGDGITDTFPFTFPIVEPSDIKLILQDSDGTQTNVESDFYVSSGTVYYPGYAPGAEPPPEEQPPKVQYGQKLIIYRDVPVTQEADLGNVWPFNVIEQMVDKVTMILQDVYNTVGRCLKVRISDISEGFDATIIPEPGKAIQIKKDGTGFECVDAPSDVLAECYVVYGQTVDAKNAAENSANSAAISEANAAASESAAAGYAENARTWANDADASATSAASHLALTEEDLAKVEGYLAAAKDVGLWDPDETYNPGDAVMTSYGDVYRCLQTTTGDDPALSPTYWAVTQTVQFRTFEEDFNGDLMPMTNPTGSQYFDIDSDGDIMPAA